MAMVGRDLSGILIASSSLKNNLRQIAVTESCIAHSGAMQARRISELERRHSQLLASLPFRMQEAFTARKEKAYIVPGHLWFDTYCGIQ